MIRRRCCQCNTRIRECMGFVNAGDFLLRADGYKVRVRELCGRCGLKLLMLDEPSELGAT